MYDYTKLSGKTSIIKALQCVNSLWITVDCTNSSNCSMSHAFPLTSWSDVQVDISCVLCSVTGEPSISEVVEVASVKNKYRCSPIDGLMESVVCSC